MYKLVVGPKFETEDSIGDSAADADVAKTLQTMGKFLDSEFQSIRLLTVV